MNYFKKDNILTINLPDSDLVFTRYLYIKDEVYIALLVSILNKSDDAIFWAYELYHSGYKHKFFELIWLIYYDFFATLNPSFESYLFKKHREWILTNGESDPTQDKIVSILVQNLLIRPFNTDIFILRNICNSFVIDIEYYDTVNINDLQDLKNNFEKWLEEDDFRSIAQWILNVNQNKINIFEIYQLILNIFDNKLTKKIEKDFLNMITKIPIDVNIILLSKIISFISKQKKLVKGKSFYINVEPEDVVQYETINNIKHYRILENACIYGIDDFKYLSLFKLKRHKYKKTLKTKYWYNWEYHASFSPIWFERIRSCNGYIDFSNKKVIFEDPDLFYSLYGYEPDEQKLHIQEKSIGEIESINTWQTFYKKYKKNGIIELYDEEIEEFDIDKILYL
jgi:hypothetical protein